MGKNQMKLKQRIKRMTVFMVMAASLSWIFSVWYQIPASIKVRAGEVEEVTFSVPATGKIYCEAVPVNSDTGHSYHVDLAKTVSFFSEDVQTYKLQVKLFGFIPFKETDVSVINDIKIMPIGEPVGIYVKTEGILVLDTGSFMGADGIKKAPAESLLQEGDYILSCNNKPVSDKKEFIELVSSCNGMPLVLEIERNDSCFTVEVQPVQDEKGEYKLGIWIRDNAQGVGTVTYIDENRNFGALGHGINDMDTSELMKLQVGSILKTEIIDIKKGQSGEPGELTGVISYSKENYVGEISENTPVGIFGEVTEDFFSEQDGEFMGIALKQEVNKGPAQVLAYTEEGQVLYDIEITKTHLTGRDSNRSIEIKVTDPQLIQKTGGIVQGMSGSPIIQKGRIVGAVTHVLVNDPTRGYGIFIEEMLEH